MAHVSLENLNLRNRFLVYCIIRKLHDKITTHYTMLMGLCKKHQDKYGFDPWCPLALLVVHGKFCLLMNKKVSTWVIGIFVWPDASWTTSGIAGTFPF